MATISNILELGALFIAWKLVPLLTEKAGYSSGKVSQKLALSKSPFNHKSINLGYPLSPTSPPYQTLEPNFSRGPAPLPLANSPLCMSYASLVCEFILKYVLKGLNVYISFQTAKLAIYQKQSNSIFIIRRLVRPFCECVRWFKFTRNGDAYTDQGKCYKV